MDHPAYESFVGAEVGQDDPGEVDQHEAVDDPLQKPVELFDGGVRCSEEGYVFECQAEARQRHQDDRCVENDVDALYLDELL